MDKIEQQLTEPEAVLKARLAERERLREIVRRELTAAEAKLERDHDTVRAPAYMGIVYAVRRVLAELDGEREET